MHSARLSDMTDGWFVGMFQPAVFNTNSCEVAMKTYTAGAKEPLHHHRLATEITLVVSGQIRMAGSEWGPGDIIVLSPGESSGFEAITDAKNVVIKLPGALDDKYLGAFVPDPTRD